MTDVRRETHRLAPAGRVAKLGAVPFCVLLLVACSAPPPSTIPSRAPATTYSAEELAAARVSDAGIVATGGFWARRSDVLFISINGGATWNRWLGPLPMRRDALGQSLVVWDQSRAWVIENAHSVAYTSDRGSTWKSAALTGDCMEWGSLTFATADTGYLVCWTGNDASARVATTNDSGATWRLVADGARTAAGRLGTHVVAAGPTEVMAAAVDQDSGTQAQLATSFDGGSSWSDVGLPGLDPQYRGEGSIRPIGSPVVFDAYRFFTVSDMSRPEGSRLRSWESADSGASWAEIGMGSHRGISNISFVSASQWIALGESPSDLALTVDGGRQWQMIDSTGLPDTQRLKMAFFNDKDGMALAITPDDFSSSWIVMFTTNDGGRQWRPTVIDAP
jgi:hypothetical protein